MNNNIQIRCIDCHVFNYDSNSNPKFLILKRATNKLYPNIWQCITGKIKPDEKAYKAAMREFKEETNLTIKNMWTIDHINHFFEPKINRLSIIPVFGIESDSQDVKLSNEHSQFKWVSATEGINHLLWNEQKKGLEVFSQMLSNNKKLEFSKIDFK